MKVPMFIGVVMTLVCVSMAVSPYLVLDLEETATHQEVIKQYKKLKKKLKKKD